jgi:lipopolysaccharide/colanic/teichoic acid biosynthesis glycosyltransferase
LLLILFPVIISVSVLIVVIDKQSPIFKQQRVKIDRKPFTIYKFQTFKNGNISNLGKLLRKLGIDEIPQLLNILKNDINFIGPRPLTQNDIDRLGWNSPFYDKRWNLKPGLTGLAQLSPLCHKKMTVFWDNYYANNQSFYLDAKILVATFFVLFLGKQKVINYIYKK